MDQVHLTPPSPKKRFRAPSIGTSFAFAFFAAIIIIAVLYFWGEAVLLRAPQ